MKSVILSNPQKRELHHLIDLLPNRETKNVKTFIEYILLKRKNIDQRIMQVLANAPIDDEILTEYEEDAICEAEKDIERDDQQSLTKVMEDFGL
ncbi:MAG: hypothetical protein H8E57_10535 [Candidatus Cloacimonetes bacterium]|nr:hypothetical protein [Candidatus Cloacimonadota bacterium]